MPGIGGRLAHYSCDAGRVQPYSLLSLACVPALVCVLCAAAVMLFAASASAFYPATLLPDDVAVVANSGAPGSKALALYYMQRRFIPWGNLIVIDTSNRESCSRREYEDKIKKPVLAALEQMRKARRNIRCLVLMQGMPLKIREKEKGKGLGTETTRASVDSELTLVRVAGYDLQGWIQNPLFRQYRRSASQVVSSENVIMVSRLDGPDSETVKRIIDDSLEAEREGLRGNACFDARWPRPSNNGTLSGYRLYDASIHHAAMILRRYGGLHVRLEDSDRLFHRGECGVTALYCGWYSLARYIDAFKWQRGAIGYHIASAECSTLKKKDSQVWCKRMLEEGIAATLGPVYEPYVQAFPLPDIFFGSLIQGASVGEAYYYSLPCLSWQMVLVADPLYRPFIARGAFRQ